MPVFPFRTPDGETVYIKAANEAEALDAFQTATKTAPITPGGLGAQAAASGPTGLAYFAGLPGTIRDVASGLEKKALKKGYELVEGKPPSAASESRTERFFADPYAETQRTLGPRGAELLRYLVQGPAAALPTGEQTVSTLHKALPFTRREPRNTAEEYARTGFEFAGPAAATELMTGGFGTLPMLFDAVLPALTSETAGQVARRFLPKERPDWMPDWMPDAETIARLGGTLFSPAGVTTTRKLVTPHPTSDTRIKYAKQLDREGVEYSAGQKTGNKTMRYRESETGGPAMEDLIDRQAEQFTGAALKRIGVNAKRATPEVMTEAASRIGGMFNRLAANNRLIPDKQMVLDLQAARNKYLDRVPANQQSRVVDGMLRDIIADTQTGSISGARYQSYITRLRETGLSGDGDLAMALRGYRNALDNAMERSIKANNPNDLGQWRVARNQYRDLSAIEDVLTTGARHEEHLINPTALDQAARRHVGQKAYTQGQYDLAELAKAGKTILKELPQSGTVPRLMARLGTKAVSGLKGGGVGGAVGSLLGGPVGGMIGGGIGAAAGPVISGLWTKGYMSKPMQKYLGNQLLRKEPPFIRDPGGLLRLLGQEHSAGSAGGHDAY